jgi:hypothetical protein
MGWKNDFISKFNPEKYQSSEEIIEIIIIKDLLKMHFLENKNFTEKKHKIDNELQIKIKKIK